MMLQDLNKPEQPLASSTPADEAVLQAIVDRFGWQETLYIYAKLMLTAQGQVTPHRRSAMDAALGYINFILPGFHFCDHELQLKREERPS